MLNVVLVGYGYWGTNVARAIHNSKAVKLLALCDISEKRLSNAKSIYGDRVEYSNSYKHYLTDKRVDAFALAIQTELSFQVGKDILNANKHLFIEKPIAVSEERGRMLTDLALVKGLILHCDHIMIYHPIIRYIKQNYDNGEFGELLYFDISRLNLGPIRTDVNSMLDLAVHDLAIIDYLSGGKIPYRINATGEKSHGMQETLTYLTLKYDEFIAHIKSSWISPLKERRIMIGCSKKMLLFDDMKSVEKLSVYNHSIEPIDKGDEYGDYEYEARTGDVLIPNIKYEDALINSIDHFAYCAETNTQSLSDGKQACRIMHILDIAAKDLLKGR